MRSDRTPRHAVGTAEHITLLEDCKDILTLNTCNINIFLVCLMAKQRVVWKDEW